MKIILQPDNSKICGQCCVAMVADCTIGEAKEATGRKGTTSTKALVKGLKALGVRCASGRLKVYRGALPETAILKIKLPWRTSAWHWVLKHKTKIYDPANRVLHVSEYEKETKYKISSYLEIFEIK